MAVGVAATSHSVLLAQASAGHPQHASAHGMPPVRAGVYELDSLPETFAYVPRQATGRHRVPLLVSLPGGGISTRDEIDMQRHLADRYGMILLSVPNNGDHKSVTAAIQQVRRKFPVDPEKIAVFGSSTGGAAAFQLGCTHMDVFSRVAPISGGGLGKGGCGTAEEQGKRKTRFLLSFGVGEQGKGLVESAEQLRQHGYEADVALNLRPHRRRLQDFEYVWRWLLASWAPQRAAPRAAPQPADSLTPLSAEALGKLNTFWTKFMDLQPFMILTARREEVRPVVLPAGTGWLTVTDMPDMPALAAKYLTVAGLLKAAGLSAGEEEAYRTAFIRAALAKNGVPTARSEAARAVEAHNVALVEAQPAQSTATLEGLMTVKIGTTAADSIGTAKAMKCLADGGDVHTCLGM